MAWKKQKAMVDVRRGTLSAQQRDELAKYEKSIQHARDRFGRASEEAMAARIVIGEALCEIKREKLYRGTHPTFEAYCEERWGFTKRWGDQLARTFVTTQNLLNFKENGKQLPISQEILESVRVVEEVSKAPKSQQVSVAKEVTKRAAEGAKVTPRLVKQVVAEVVPETDRRKPAPKKKPAKAVDPDGKRAIINRVADVCRDVGAALTALADASDAEVLDARDRLQGFAQQIRLAAKVLR